MTSAVNGHRDAVLKDGSTAPMMSVGTDIPHELRGINRWLCWNWNWNAKRKKWDKIPITPAGAASSSTNPEKWTNFDGALSGHHVSKFGVGFVFNGDGLIGVDLDDIRNPKTGEIVEWAQAIIDKLATYCEVSPSGTGVKLFLRGTLPAKSRCEYRRDDGAALEVFCNGRYFTVTGHALAGTPNGINERTTELAEVLALAETWRPKREKKTGGNLNGHVHHAAEEPQEDRATALAALAVLDPDMGYSDWLRVLMALHSVDVSLLQDAVAWSYRSEKFAHGEIEDKWTTFTAGSGVGIATLCAMADETGQQWRPKKTRQRRSRPASENDQQQDELEADSEDPWTDIRCEEGRTDAAFARRFLKAYGDTVLYVPEWECWLWWDGKRWVIDVGGCAVVRLSQAVSDAIWHEFMLFKTEDASDYAHEMSKPSKWKSALKPAATMRVVSVPELNQNPMLLNCVNGVVDLRTGEMRQHDKADRITKLCTTEFDPAAKCPTWEKFIADVFADSAALIAYTQRLCGWWITAAIMEHLLHIAYGIGANGKSTFFNALLDVLGRDYAMQAPPDLLVERKGEAHPTERADLFGMRLVVASETSGGAKLAESLVKQLTGGDKIRARKMRQDFWEFDPTHKLVLLTNHKPRVRGQDLGIWRRLRMLPFNQVFIGDKADKLLPNKLKAEAPGILAWCVRGCLEWQKHGLVPPPEVQAATTEYQSSQDVFGRFVAELCEFGSSNFEEKFSNLRDALESWCNESGENMPGPKTFAQWLEDQGCKRFRSNGMKYRGIQLKA